MKHIATRAAVVAVLSAAMAGSWAAYAQQTRTGVAQKPNINAARTVLNTGPIRTVFPTMDASGAINAEVNYLKGNSKGPGAYSLYFRLSSSDAKKFNISYASGTLTLSGEQITGSGTRYYSDRLYPKNPNQGGIIIADSPFDAKSTEDVSITLSASGPKLRVNNKRINNLTYDRGVYYGYGNDAVLYTLMLEESFVSSNQPEIP